MKTIKLGASLLLGVGMVSGAIAQETLYNNSMNSLNQSLAYVPGTEIGDEIILEGLGDGNQWASVSSMLFEFNPIGFSGDETFRIRFYRVDGEAQVSDLLFDSGDQVAVDDPNADVTTIQLSGFSEEVFVPQRFVWTVSFGNVSPDADEAVALGLFGPPTVGNGFTDYWVNDEENGWQLLAVDGAADSSFSAVFNGVGVVPEPSTVALGLFGGVFFLGSWLRKRFCK